MHDNNFPNKFSTEILDQLITAYNDMKQKSLMQAKSTDSHTLRMTLLKTVSEYEATVKQLQKLHKRLNSSQFDESSTIQV